MKTDAGYWFGTAGDGGRHFTFYCPGCEHHHVFIIFRGTGDGGITWQFDGNELKPTFSPSLLNNAKNNPYHVPHMPVCHLFLRNGVIDFLSDCTHSYAGKKVALEQLAEIVAKANAVDRELMDVGDEDE
jgi:Family of unknown function (DUF6527)